MAPDVTDDRSAPDAARPTFPAVLLCGGAGTRLDTDREKPMVPVGGEPMVARVLDALTAADRVGPVHAVAAPRTPATLAYLRERRDRIGHGGIGSRTGVDAGADSGSDSGANADTGLHVHEGAGEGYVADLDAALEHVGRPAVTVAADLPLLAAEYVDRAVADAVAIQPHSGGGSLPDGPVDSLAVCVPESLKRGIGVSTDTTFDHDGVTVAPTGLNVVGDGPDRVVVREDRRLAVNVNRPQDLAVARRLLDD